MKKSISGFLFLIVCGFSVFAQAEEARMIDEFGVIPCDEYLARVDAMAIEKANNQNAQIYVFIYEGKEKIPDYNNGNVTYKTYLPRYGLAKAKIESMKKYLEFRKFTPQNYVFANGGFREEFRVEIWLVPPGAEAPKPTPTLEKMKYRKGKAKGFCTSCC